MGSLQQQSTLKGKKVNSENEAIIPKIFQNIQAQFSKQIAIIYEDKSEEFKITYEELECLTNKLAKTLKRLCTINNNRDAIIAVSMKPTYNLPITLLAILKSGMAYLPLDAEFPQARVTHIIDESQPLMVIVDDDNKLLYGKTPVMRYNELYEESKIESDVGLIYNEDPEQLAIVLYTSGSTGVPKGVRIPHATLINRLEWQWRELPYTDKEQKTIFKTALTFVDSAPEIWGSLLQGRTIVVVPKHVTKDPEKFINVLETHKIQRLVLVPSLLQSMLMYLSLQDNGRSLKSLRLWICSGEILPQTLAKEFFNRFADYGHTLANFYGSTEVMGDVTYFLLNNTSQLEDMDKVPIGRPLDNCIIYIVDKNLNLVEQGEIGELVVAGRNLAAGYIRGRDSHRFVNNPHAVDPEYSTIYRTGDYAKIIKGIVIYEGRTDSQIKVRGHRVDLSEVERSVEALPSVDKAVVLCYKPGDLAQALIAFITLKKGTKITGLQLENYLQNQLPSYMIPHIIIIDSIPLLINGKTDRQTLLKLYETSNLHSNGRDTIDCDYTEVPDEQLDKARVLFPTVASVIGRSGRYTVNINANFYDLGGNSLNSIFTVTQLKKQGYHIAISDFLTAKSMRDILDKIVMDSNHQEIDSNDSVKFIAEPINDGHRSTVTRMVTESFYLKADLERWLSPNIKRSDYVELMDTLWRPIVDKELSFIIRSTEKDGTVLGVALNFDAYDEPDCVVTSKLAIVFEFLEYLEGPIRANKLPCGKGKILHCYMMATNENLTPAENVIIMNKMEEECLNLARRKGFVGIFTTNTSPLTQQLGTDVYNYEVLLDYQVNQYVAPDGSKPFGDAPDDQRAICSWKTI
ncbi:beta-alanyl-bioamine nonribosomal peptide synthetase ebony [Microplitis mediator]|uniref:beta-alanyl-bioamine nonribosomal peptide synthetase ebony n=1 Tax=Microplitis mediator TaxID=375433 RepID=UPI002556F7C8|nr:beta-alanyl-bioamine nonribosomal peptide synthetase ebony [Microplitis mediator]XP_057319544.1 beta-alanyl-bioamine nonribosomal peptide synthetase ebony [Microplitis mediator]